MAWVIPSGAAKGREPHGHRYPWGSLGRSLYSQDDFITAINEPSIRRLTGFSQDSDRRALRFMLWIYYAKTATEFVEHLPSTTKTKAGGSGHAGMQTPRLWRRVSPSAERSGNPAILLHQLRGEGSLEPTTSRRCNLDCISQVPVMRLQTDAVLVRPSNE